MTETSQQQQFPSGFRPTASGWQPRQEAENATSLCPALHHGGNEPRELSVNHRPPSRACCTALLIVGYCHLMAILHPSSRVNASTFFASSLSLYPTLTMPAISFLPFLNTVPWGTRIITGLLVAASLAHYLISAASTPASPPARQDIPWLVLMPRTSWKYPWTLLTAGFVELNIIEVSRT